MKQKINVVFHKLGTESESVIRMIANMNEGSVQFSPRDLEGYFNCRKASFVLALRDICLVKDATDPNVYHISEDGGKTFILSLEWIDVYELQSNG